jgi:hypothetical protein
MCIDGPDRAAQVWSLSNYMANVWVFFSHPAGLQGSPQTSPRQAHSPPRVPLAAQRKKSM